jgi:Domain of unknown function (DUF4190)
MSTGNAGEQTGQDPPDQPSQAQPSQAQPSQGQPGPGQPGLGQPGPGQPFYPGPGQPSYPGPGQPPPYPGSGQPAPGQPSYPGSGQQPPYPGPYIQAGAGWPQMAGRRTNALAIAALCCAIGQVIVGPFAGIAAIVLGAISLKQIRVTGEDGRGLAITGLVVGIVGTVLAVLLIVFVLALFHGVASNVNN